MLKRSERCRSVAATGCDWPTNSTYSANKRVCRPVSIGRPELKQSHSDFILVTCRSFIGLFFICLVLSRSFPTYARLDSHYKMSVVSKPNDLVATRVKYVLNIDQRGK